MQSNVADSRHRLTDAGMTATAYAAGPEVARVLTKNNISSHDGHSATFDSPH